jgi:hypothetical protein
LPRENTLTRFPSGSLKIIERFPQCWATFARIRRAGRGEPIRERIRVTIRGRVSSLPVPPQPGGRVQQEQGAGTGRRSSQMNSQPDRVAPGTAGTPPPVGPSLIVKIVMRPLTKMLNPLIVKLAGRRHFHMAARIRHVGRRSGRTYTTPVSARRSGDVVVIALTFGNQSDWSRNVRSPEARQSGSRVRTSTSRSRRS